MTTDEQINTIRIKALASLGAEPRTKCPTCGRAAGSPFRIYNDRGKVVHGCIDAFHSGHLMLGESRCWHNRPEAKALRRTVLVSLKALKGRAS